MWKTAWDKSWLCGVQGVLTRIQVSTQQKSSLHLLVSLKILIKIASLSFRGCPFWWNHFEDTLSSSLPMGSTTSIVMGGYSLKERFRWLKQWSIKSLDSHHEQKCLHDSSDKYWIYIIYWWKERLIQLSCRRKDPSCNHHPTNTCP